MIEVQLQSLGFKVKKRPAERNARRAMLFNRLHII